MEEFEEILRKRFENEETEQDKKYFLGEISRIIKELWWELK